MSAEHEEFARPPVSEVNLTFWFETIYTLSALHLSTLRNAWANELPRVEEKAPLAPWNPTDSITFVDDKWPMPACIFASKEREKQILIQADRFGLTWYFTPNNRYPGFAELSQDFKKRFEEFTEALRESGNEDPALVRATIEYENYLDLFDSNIVSRRVVAGEQITEADQDVITEGTTAVRKHVCPTEKNSNITLLVGVDSTRRGEGISFAASALDTADKNDDGKAPATLLTISGRADLSKGDDPAERLQQAHDELYTLFTQLFDDSLKSSWGER
ncbi:hypothetical protein GCM10027258_10480 [Amycolatopsis stemonae]